MKDELERAAADLTEDPCPTRSDSLVVDVGRSGLAAPSQAERMSSPMTHPLLEILAAMVREALEYERRERREAA